MTLNPYEPPNVGPETSARSSPFDADSRCLRYSIDFDDIMRFQQFHFSHSPTLRNQRYGLMAITAVSAGMFCFLNLPEISIRSRLVIALVFAALSAMAIRLLLKWSMTSQARKLLREGSNTGITGDHELRINEHGLTEVTAVNETRHAFSGIVRIEESDDHAFIYTSTLQAHVIPKNKVSSGDVVGFMAQVRKLVPNAISRTMR